MALPNIFGHMRTWLTLRCHHASLSTSSIFGFHGLQKTRFLKIIVNIPARFNKARRMPTPLMDMMFPATSFTEWI